KLEPGSPPPGERIELIARLTGEGIDVGLDIMPVLPGISDRLDSLARLVEAATRAGARRVRARPLALPPAMLGGFLAFLERERPDLVPRYAAHYSRTAAAPVGYERRVLAMVEGIGLELGLATGPEPGCDEARQLALPFGGDAGKSRYAVGPAGARASRIGA
ncbi:MAG: radical SAM family protein, partial [Planctomycetota bacterium]